MSEQNRYIDLSSIQDFNLNLDQYFGMWAVDEQRFLQMFDRVCQMDLAAHVSSRLASQISLDGGSHFEKLTSDFYNPTALETAAAEGVTGRQAEKNIALIDIRGTMTKRGSSLSDSGSTIRIRQDVRAAAKDPDIGGILLRIDSPGGSVAGTADLGTEIKNAKSQKPVFAFIEDLGASAAYWIASQADQIFANDSTALIGSIGTFIGLYDLSGLAAREGIRPIVIKSGEFKGTGFEGSEITKEQQDYLQTIVDKTQAAFSSAVSVGRNMQLTRVNELADGRVHTAPDAHKFGLIDGIQSFEETVSALSQEKPRGSRVQAQVPENITMSTETTTTQSQPESRPATIQEIKQSCPGIDNDFSVGLLEQGATVDQAKTQWMAEQQKRLDAKEKELDDAKANSSTLGVDPDINAGGKAGSTGGDEDEETGDAVSDFGAAVTALTARGVDRSQAVATVAKKNPGLHQRFVLATNSNSKVAQRLINEKYNI